MSLHNWTTLVEADRVTIPTVREKGWDLRYARFSDMLIVSYFLGRTKAAATPVRTATK